LTLYKQTTLSIIIAQDQTDAITSINMMDLPIMSEDVIIERMDILLVVAIFATSLILACVLIITD